MSTLSFKDFYTSKSNPLNLQEALDLHYQLNPQFTKWFDYPTKTTQETMKSHDTMHIVFGCGTTLAGEFRVEILTFFCSNLSLKEYSKMVANSEINKEPFEIIKRIGFFKVFWVMLTHIWYLPYGFYVAQKMHKKWPVLDTITPLKKSIGELRAEYGIKILSENK